MPALPAYIVEPIWDQFVALLPAAVPPRADHPLGCHRSRIPDRTVFEKLVQVLVFGCAYERIADETCSATTLRRRHDERIAHGVMNDLRAMALEAYDRQVHWSAVGRRGHRFLHHEGSLRWRESGE